MYRRNGVNYTTGFQQAVFRNEGRLYSSYGMATDCRTITPASRVSFYKAFGIMPDDQILFEKQCNFVVKDLGDGVITQLMLDDIRINTIGPY